MRKIGYLLILALGFFPFFHAEAATPKAPIVFLLDTSGSMKSEKIKAVKSAVSKIIRGLEKDQPIEIITFSDSATTILQPTTNFDYALVKLEQITATGDTAMYDALHIGLLTTLQGPVSQILLLSDGEDTASFKKFEDIIAEIEKSGTPVNTIGIQVEKPQRNILNTLSTVSGGNYYPVDDISTLIATYQTILADKLSDTSINPNPIEDNYQSIRNIYVEILIAIFASIVLYFLYLEIYRRNQERKARLARAKTIERYSYRRLRKVSNKIKISFSSYKFVPRRIEIAIRNKLDLIHSEVQYEKVIQGLIGLWVFLVLLFFLPTKSIVLSIIFASLLVPLIFNSITNYLRSKQEIRFAEELPELLNILAGALRAGLSLQQGLEAYTTDSGGEVAREIRRAISEIRVGTPVDEALMGVALRMKSEDLKWAVTALSIQRVVGGSMATILTTTFETVKARAEIRREVKTLSAEGKLSAYVLISLPIGIFLFLALTRREYVKVFWTDPAGIFLMVVIGVSLSIGWAWMKKIVEIKI